MKTMMGFVVFMFSSLTLACPNDVSVTGVHNKMIAQGISAAGLSLDQVRNLTMTDSQSSSDIETNDASCSTITDAMVDFSFEANVTKYQAAAFTYEYNVRLQELSADSAAASAYGRENVTCQGKIKVLYAAQPGSDGIYKTSTTLDCQ